MELKNTLEVILITYNRKKYLQHTLEQLFDKKSPVKNLDFTVLDNASTDGSSELIESYCVKFPNIKHIRRPRNIGGNANIASAFSIVSKKYYWIVCDDDEFDFSAWQEVENAIKAEYDIIMLNPSRIVGDITLPRLLNGTTFVPSVIAKSENITESVLYDTFENVTNWFPQLAPVCAVINKKGSFYVTSKDIVYDTLNEIKNSGPGHKKIKGISDQAKHKFFYPCYINSLYLIKDKKLRAELVDDFFSIYIVKRDFICNIEDLVKGSYNYFMPLTVMTLWQKIKFLLFIFFIHILYLFGFRSYLWYQFDKTPKWQMKLIRFYQRYFKRK